MFRKEWTGDGATALGPGRLRRPRRAHVPEAHGPRGLQPQAASTSPSHSEPDAPQCSRWAPRSLTGLQQESVAGTAWGHRVWSCTLNPGDTHAPGRSLPLQLRETCGGRGTGRPGRAHRTPGRALLLPAPRPPAASHPSSPGHPECAWALQGRDPTGHSPLRGTRDQGLPPALSPMTPGLPDLGIGLGFQEKPVTVGRASGKDQRAGLSSEAVGVGEGVSELAVTGQWPWDSIPGRLAQGQPPLWAPSPLLSTGQKPHRPRGHLRAPTPETSPLGQLHAT